MQRRAVKFLLKTIISFAFLFIGHSAFAQGQFTVKLKLVDEKTSAPVAYATASLKVKGEETASKYVLTDANGAASLTKVKKGTYIFKAELMGYKAYEKEIVVDKNVDLGDIKMAEDAEVLDAASVSAAGNPIIVKKDTIEYNASSFKTSDNDMLEELLKKLPGVEVGTDGSITANGETIKKITIDGKTFFLDDPQLATKNIPAKLINKVKVVEKKSEQAEFTGIDDGNEETIIDLSIRPGMMNGVFGNIMAGGGHDVPSPTNDMNDWRYQGAAMVGRFTDKSQVSLILNANNTNNRGFNDMAGSMVAEWVAEWAAGAVVTVLPPLGWAVSTAHSTFLMTRWSSAETIFTTDRTDLLRRRVQRLHILRMEVISSMITKVSILPVRRGIASV